MASLTSYGIEMELAGGVICDETGTIIDDEAGAHIDMDGYGFVDISEDVLDGVRWEKGIMDSDILSRVAGIGSLRFRLNNSAANSAGLAGYYSPDNSNVRGGFDNDRRVRLYLNSRYKWAGVITKITPTPGIYGKRDTAVEAASSMLFYDEYGTMNLNELQEGVRPDEIYESITDGLTRQPPSWAFATDNNSLNFVFDTATRNKPNALNELNKIAISSFNRILEIGDDVHGGQIISKTFSDYMKDTTVLYTLTEMHELEINRERSKQFDYVVAVTHPRSVIDTTDLTEAELEAEREVIWSLDSALAIGPAETITITANYVDPNSEGTRIAAKNVRTTTVAGVDHYFGAVEKPFDKGYSTSLAVGDGLRVVIVPGATSAQITFTNLLSNHAGYINNAYLHGIAIRSYNPVESRETADNPTADRELKIDLPYQDLRLRGLAVAQTVRDEVTSSHSEIVSVGFHANRTAALLAQAVAREPGDRIAITESITGLSAGEYFINGESGTLSNRGNLNVTWVLSKAPPSDVLLIDITGRDEIDGTNYIRGI